VVEAIEKAGVTIVWLEDLRESITPLEKVRAFAGGAGRCGRSRQAIRR
jgi:hypothetical protein